MTRETQRQLYWVLKAHKSELEITRGAPSGLDLEVFNRRIVAARQLVEWLSPALELGPPASPTVQTPPSSPNPPKATRRWISHSGGTPTDLVV